jgi:hypothetical protein
MNKIINIYLLLLKNSTLFINIRYYYSYYIIFLIYNMLSNINTINPIKFQYTSLFPSTTKPLIQFSTPHLHSIF